MLGSLYPLEARRIVLCNYIRSQTMSHQISCFGSNRGKAPDSPFSIKSSQGADLNLECRSLGRVDGDFMKPRQAVLCLLVDFALGSMLGNG